MGRRRWLAEARFDELAALGGLLPGPAGSQLGFAVGHERRGVPGGLAAWLGFSLPPAVAMIVFAYGIAAFGGMWNGGWVRGLVAAAVAVAAQAVFAMWRRHCPDVQRSVVAAVAGATAFLAPSAATQVSLVALGAAWGLAFWQEPAAGPSRRDEGAPVRSGGRRGAVWFVICGMLLGALPVGALFCEGAWLGAADGFYRAGALAFGGDPAVLPLLEREVVGPGWVARDRFLAGYAVVQALPGPSSALSAYLGVSMSAGPSGWLGGLGALAVFCAPGLLLGLGALSCRETLCLRPDVRAAQGGACAAVVGLLAAAFVGPVWSGGVAGPWPLAVVAVAFVALQGLRAAPWKVVLGAAIAGAAFL